MHHQLAKRAVIVVIVSCLSDVSISTPQPIFESMEPAKYIFHHQPPSDVLYLIRKSGGEKASQQQNEIVTFAGNYIVSIYLPLTKLKITDFFLY